MRRRGVLWSSVGVVALMGSLVQPVAAAAAPASTASSVDLLAVAKKFLDVRTAVLVDGPSHHAASWSSGSADLSASLAVAEGKVAQELAGRRAAVNAVGEAYTGFDTTLTVVESDLAPGSARLVVEEHTELHYAKIRGDEPEFTAWQVPREFTFTLRGATWELDSQKILNESGLPPVTEPTGASAAEALAAVQAAALADAQVGAVERAGAEAEHEAFLAGQVALAQGPVPLATFSRTAARDYAVQYWSNYNSSYRSWDGQGQGGDCTNFVSQAMRAGGWTDDSGWYQSAENWWYNWLNETTSWINVVYWHDFASVYSGRTYILSQPRSLIAGEVLQADFTNNASKDHSMIVTTKTTSEIYLTYHSTNTLNKSFAQILSSYPSARWYPHLVYTSF